MVDQLIIGDKASFDDYFASLAKRKIGNPKKKVIKETIPYSNITYDFSKVNGELYWEERELEFVFEIIADTPEKLEDLKTAFSGWMMNVFQEQIHDPFIPEYHFLGTFEDIDFEDEESLDKTTATVRFTAYPYKIANTPTVYRCEANALCEFYLQNNSAHPVVLTIETSETTTLYVNDDKKNTAQVRAYTLMLPVGVTKFKVVEGGVPFVVTASFVEEVF